MRDPFTGGELRAALDGRTEIRRPADGCLAGVVDAAGGTDTAEAIAAARRAFDEGPWPRTPARARPPGAGHPAGRAVRRAGADRTR